jgi:hypothetical protein
LTTISDGSNGCFLDIIQGAHQLGTLQDLGHLKAEAAAGSSKVCFVPIFLM